MAPTTQVLIVATGMAAPLLAGLPTPHALDAARPAVSCAPGAAPAIPADYLFYHAMVAPHPVRPPGQAGKRSFQASCTPRQKVIRT